MGIDISALNLREVFSIATRIEEDGIEFYRAASENTRNKRLWAVLDALLVQEFEHKIILQDMAKEFGIYLNPDPRAIEISPQTVEALTEAEIFPRPEERDSAFASLHSPVDVVRFSIQVEKGAASFYKQALKAAESEQVRGQLEKILAQEERHVRVLKEVLKELKAKQKS